MAEQVRSVGVVAHDLKLDREADLEQRMGVTMTAAAAAAAAARNNGAATCRTREKVLTASRANSLSTSLTN